MTNFDNIVERKGSNCYKYDLLNDFFGSDDMMPLWVADTDFECPDFVINAISNRLTFSNLGYSFRSDNYYNAIISWVEKRNNWTVKKEWLDFCPGVVAGLAFGMNAFTQEGDGVLIQTPVYPPFFDIVRRNNRKLLENPLMLVDGKWQIDFEDFEAKIKEAKVFLMCNPHNPSGRVFTKEELLRMGELCLKYGVKIISDEIHSDLIYYGNKHIHIGSLSQQLADISISIISPSKTFNIASLYTSVVIAPNAELHEKFKNEAMKFHIDNGNELGARALESAYTQGSQWVDKLNAYIQSNLDYVVDYIGANMPKIKAYRPEATFLLWLDLSEISTSKEVLCDFMYKKAKLALNYGADYGVNGEGYMRLNVGTSRAMLQQAMVQLQEAYDKL